MSLWKIIVINIIISSSIALPASYYCYNKIMSEPVGMPVTIFDTGSYVKNIDVNSPDYLEQANLLTNIAKKQVELLTKQGFIVIDSSSIIGAPDEYYIRATKQ